MRLLKPRHPDRHDAERPLVIDQLLDLEEDSKQEGVSAILDMLKDLHLASTPNDCRYAESLKGSVLWELKTRSRGGQKGGARVYWFPTENNEAVICTCEVKEGDAPDPALLILALKLFKQYENGTIRY